MWFIIKLDFLEVNFLRLSVSHISDDLILIRQLPTLLMNKCQCEPLPQLIDLILEVIIFPQKFLCCYDPIIFPNVRNSLLFFLLSHELSFIIHLSSQLRKSTLNVAILR